MPARRLIVPISLLALAALPFLALDTQRAAPGFTPGDFLAYAAIMFAAGMTSGLTGFAFSAIGALSLFLLAPIVAVPILQGSSACNQVLSVGKLRQDMPRTLRDWFPCGPGPAILGGLAGIELGTRILYALPARQIKVILGVLIAIYALYALFKPAGARLTRFDGWKSGVVVGALGGTIGGFTAFPGLTVVMWAGLRDLPKAASRAIVQPMILTLQLAALARNAIGHPENFGPAFWIMMALSLPVVLPGTLTGVWLYRKMSDVNFKQATGLALLLAGAMLIANAMWLGR
jgi:uncharacterized membrane protein YfcA